jgi:hypothetical protein
LLRLAILIFLPFSLFAKITATIEKPVVVRGSSTTLVVKVEGKDIETPNISQLGGARISGIARESFYHSVNGVTSRGIKIRYGFSPDKNTTIEPLRFVADGVEFFTKPIQVTVVEPSSNASDPFQLILNVDKKKLYVGETFKVDVIYKEDLSKEVVERRYEEPRGSGIWNKGDTPIQEERKGRYAYFKTSYLYTPQRSGKIDISSAKMRVGTRAKKRDAWGFFFENVKWQEVISNRVSINAFPAPHRNIGDFKISAEVDENVITRGEAINLTLRIEGNGNVEDIEPFAFEIENGVVYDEKPKVEHKIENGKYKGVFTQKFAVIFDKNDVIQPFKFEFFNPEVEKIISATTDKILIQVINPVSKIVQVPDEVVIERKIVKKDNENIDDTNEKFSFQNFAVQSSLLIIVFLSGFVFAIIVKYIPYKKISGIFKFLGKREKLKQLLPTVHNNSEDYQNAKKIEAQLYTKS